MNDKKLGGLPTDGRRKGDYKTKYPPEIIKKQWCEAIYIFVLMLFAFVFMLFAFLDIPLKSFNLQPDKYNVAIKTIYCMAGGLLGGATFDMKCLYRAISSRMWNEDRAFWRIFSPFVSISLALIICAIFSDKIISSTGFFAVSLGFFSGYFSDEAVGKMYDVALVIFSRESSTKKETSDTIDDGDEAEK